MQLGMHMFSCRSFCFCSPNSRGRCFAYFLIWWEVGTWALTNQWADAPACEFPRKIFLSLPTILPLKLAVTRWPHQDVALTMRLLNAKTRRLENFSVGNRPECAILSHTWGEQEVSFQDVEAASLPPTSWATKRSSGPATKLSSED